MIRIELYLVIPNEKMKVPLQNAVRQILNQDINITGGMDAQRYVLDDYDKYLNIINNQDYTKSEQFVVMTVEYNNVAGFLTISYDENYGEQFIAISFTLAPRYQTEMGYLALRRTIMNLLEYKEIEVEQMHYFAREQNRQIETLIKMWGGLKENRLITTNADGTTEVINQWWIP